MELLNRYKEVEQQLFDYFGYREDWHVYSIQDHREYFWRLAEDAFVKFAFTEEDIGEGDGFSYEVMPDRFLPQSVYVGAAYTMILVDTHTDGNKFLAIFDNSKKR